MSRRHACLLALILCVHLLLLAWQAWRNSPVFSEVGHLPAGLSHWKYGMFDLYRVNPPLPRMVAAIPILLTPHQERWTTYDNRPDGRSEILVGCDFLRVNDSNSLWLYTLGRWACLPFSAIGLLVCFLWARALFGSKCGLLAAILWCFCPNVLGNGALVMPDVPAAALGVLAGFVFWNWLTESSPSKTILSGVTLGLAELSKFTWLVLYPIFFALWLVQRYSTAKSERQSPLRALGQLCLLFAVSLFVIHAGYGFSGVGTKLGDFTFVSRVLTGHDEQERSGNRFVESRLAELPVPVPEEFLQGLDRQKADFDGPMWSYLRGRWQLGGWWYFYLYAFVIKMPLGVLGLCCLSFVLIWRRAYRSDLESELCLMAPAIAVFYLVSSQTAFSIHPRYVLPALPFLFIWVSRCARSFSIWSKPVAAIASFCVIWTTASSLWTYPHSLSYFNETVGGPTNGHLHLVDSGSAWGQDVLYLKDWYERHPEARPLRVASFGWVDPQIAGIRYTLPPLAPVKADNYGDNAVDALGPKPGWYAVDVNHLQGTIWDAPDGTGGRRSFWMDFGKPVPNFTYFNRFKPIDTVAYSYRIYHITPSEANCVRRELGLPVLIEQTSHAAGGTD